MMKGRIFLRMGLIVLFLIFGIGSKLLAQEIYKVKRGDTLASMAKKYGLSPEALRAANALKGDWITYNQNLIIPGKAKQKAANEKTAKSDGSTSGAAYLEEDNDLPGEPLGNVPLAEAEKDASSDADLLGK